MAFPGGASNWLAVTADHTASGHPIAVMGPQVGYWSPEILMEMDIHAPSTDRGPGVDARGATFPGISLYVLLGRGPDYAWSATSGSSDLTDVRAERLCEPNGEEPGIDSTHYIYRGSCIRLLIREDKWLAKPSPGGPGLPVEVTATVQRSVHGPVFARGLVKGRPVAFVQQRSTYFAELDSALAFVPLNSGMVTDAGSFQRTMNLLTGSFNWLYVDDRDVAYFHSGLYPIRAQGVDPNFPSWGTGPWEWRGFLPFSGHPRQINTGRGWLDSWNNKPAAGWRAADNKWDYGSVHRSEMLSDRLAQRIPRGNVTPSDMVEIMATAATVDLRGQEVLPPILRLIGDDPGLRPYLRVLSDWVASGAHRLDRDGDGQYEDNAPVALMDEWWERLIHGAFDRTLDGLYGHIPMVFDDHPGPVGSAFLSGYYGYVEKSVRMAAGEPVSARFRVLRCGDGTRVGCRAALIRSLWDAIEELGRDPSAWDACESCDAIRFTAIGLVNIPDIPWQNRPTFQQVVHVESHRPR
jgi:acyl-homoserine lactone acylase PvdQ